MLDKIKTRKLIIEPDVIIEKESFANAWYRGLRHIKNNGREIKFGGVDQNKKFEKKTAYDSDLANDHLSYPEVRMVKLSITR